MMLNVAIFHRNLSMIDFFCGTCLCANLDGGESC